MRAWYAVAKNARWASPADVKRDSGTASFLGKNRVVFNIAGNKYRLVVSIAYERQAIFVRFIGTHREYDEINVEEI